MGHGVGEGRTPAAGCWVVPPLGVWVSPRRLPPVYRVAFFGARQANSGGCDDACVPRNVCRGAPPHGRWKSPLPGPVHPPRAAGGEGHHHAKHAGGWRIWGWAARGPCINPYPSVFVHGGKWGWVPRFVPVSSHVERLSDLQYATCRLSWSGFSWPPASASLLSPLFCAQGSPVAFPVDDGTGLGFSQSGGSYCRSAGLVDLCTPTLGLV